MAGTARLPQMRGPSMWTAAAIGFSGGFCLAYQVLFPLKNIKGNFFFLFLIL